MAQAQAHLSIRSKLDRALAYWRAVIAGEGFFWTVAALLVAFMVCFHVDRWLVLSIESRIAAWAVMGILGSGLLIFRVLRPVLRPHSPEEVARMVEQRYPELRERLLSAVEFSGESPSRLQGVSPVLLADLMADAEQASAPLDFKSAFKRRDLMNAVGGLGIAALLLAIHFLAAGPAFGAFLSRMALSNTPVWRDTRVQVAPLRTKVLKGSDFQVMVSQEGKRVNRGRLDFQFGNGRWNRAELKAGDDGRFTHRFATLTEGLTYVAHAGDGVSDKGIVEVVDPAAIVGAKLTLTYPAYLDRPAAKLTADSGGIAAPVGTTVRLELKANKPLDMAEATVMKSAPANWSVSGDTITGHLVVQKDGQYSLKLRDQDGFLAPELQTFPIKAIQDQTPEVQLRDPAGDLEVVPDARVRLDILAKDDYGVAQVRVPYEASRQKPASLTAGVGNRKDKVLELESLWELAALKLKPGDSVTYRIEALDHDNLNGPHVGRTSEYHLRVIDAAEAERRYAEQRAEVMQQLAELIREQKGVRTDVKTQQAAAKPNADAIGSAEERQRATANTSSELARRIADLNRMAETNNLADKSDLDSQNSARKSLSSLAQQAMPQAANRIGSAQSRAESSPSEAKADLGKASDEQQKIIDELNKIAEQMKPGSELKRLADRFDRLARQQRNLQAQTDKLLPSTLGKSMDELTPQQRQQLSQLGQQQQNLQKATSQAIQDLERAGQSMQSRNAEQGEAASQAAQDLQQGQVTEQQGQASQSTQQNSLGQARSQQENAAQQLENAAQQLRDAMNPNDPRNQQRLLRQAMNRLNRMMQQQGEAIRQNQSGAMSQQQRQEQAELQRQLAKQAQELARQLERLQRRTPSAGKASEQVKQAGENSQQAGQSLSQQGQSQSQQQQSQQQASQQQQKSLQAMQRAMQSLQQAMAEAQQNDDPFAELRKQIDRLVTRQKAIQQATQRIDTEQAQKGMDPEDKAELDRLAGQQGEVESETAKLEPELPGDVFRNFSGQARRAMTRAKDALAQANPKKNPTQVSQQRALSVLEQLKKALDPNPDDNSEEEGGGGGGGQQQGGGQQDPELPKRLAEIRLLRALQQGIRSQTQDVDDARSGDQPLSEAQKEQLEEATRQQAAAKALAEKVAQGLARQRQLAGKVTQAGKHMSEAQRGLDRQETGDAVQEQESQAIVRLTEALKLAQRQSRQQQQQQQQRQQQQQQQGQQQGQQAQGQPSGGQQQQGNAPALRSLARRSGRSDGPLAGIGEGRGFGGLDPRAQDALRQGYKEKVPPEYQDLIQRYYRGLSSQGK